MVDSGNGIARKVFLFYMGRKRKNSVRQGAGSAGRAKENKRAGAADCLYF